MLPTIDAQDASRWDQISSVAKFSIGQWPVCLWNPLSAHNTQCNLLGVSWSLLGAYPDVPRPRYTQSLSLSNLLLVHAFSKNFFVHPFCDHFAIISFCNHFTVSFSNARDRVSRLDSRQGSSLSARPICKTDQVDRSAWPTLPHWTSSCKST